MININVDGEKLNAISPLIADGLKDERIKAMCLIIDEKEALFLRVILQEAGFIFDEDLIFLVFRFLLITRPLREQRDKEHKEFLNFIKVADNLERFIHESELPFDEITLKRGKQSVSIKDKELLNLFSFIIRIGDVKDQRRKKLHDAIVESKMSGKFPNYITVKGGKPVTYSDYFKYQITWELCKAILDSNSDNSVKPADLELFIGKLLAKAGWLDEHKPPKSSYLTDEDFLIKNIHNFIKRYQEFINRDSNPIAGNI